MTTEQDKNRISKIEQVALAEVDNDIIRAHNDLFDPIKVPAAQLPEHIFVQRFLPFFCGEVQDSAQLNIRTTWVGIAGAATAPVDIVGTDGKVLYQVPALMNTEFLHRNDSIRGQTFNQIFNHAREQANRIPQLGENVIAEIAGNKLAEMTPVPETSSEQQWKKIFERYNIKSADTSDKSTAAKETFSDDEFEQD